MGRNGAVLSVEETDGRCRILANVAAAELFGYSADLGSMTKGWVPTLSGSCSIGRAWPTATISTAIRMSALHSGQSRRFDRLT